ncbi:efflux RND transporter permease subunit [Gemmobacter lutimaris]|uniref:Efflux pump membrane transporter n=1 Tax=Gemmobacter lutimaris TaxID=2306023 RepID=A0A398BXH7_9RHOB|nr:efflux RND transporter permease subunit [Gemmobacter lutimaris]RID93531.1 efflux RND transporter permease subunit [Gemmobacter lutimaris]
MAGFFIDRPVFAWVLAIITMLAGAWGLTTLPVSQYPDIAPTTIRISASYPGASAETIENSVTSVMEDGLTGLDGLLYMTSSSYASGRATVTLTFGDSTDPDMAQIQVQNKLQLIQNGLPETVRQRGISVTRSSSSILMVGALVSRDGRFTSLQLGDLMGQIVEDAVLRTEGVGSINSFGSGYAMRIWLDPLKMAQYRVTTADVTSAVSEQNSTVTVGSLGSQPVVPGQQLSVALNAQAQLATVEEFERIILRTTADGSTVFLGDVARVEIGQESYGASSRYNGMPAAGFGINLATGANAVDTAERVRETLTRVSAALPEGVEVVYPYDTSPFVEASIEKVYHTLGEAVVLVFLVILVFLQSWRATIIPTIAVPVVLLGTFGILAAAGLTINTLTMFALVLAIGLLVDDAIVVVENVERVMEEEGLEAREATRKSMHQITPALVGIALVLSAVFLPMAFMSGSTGVIYRQFSVTIISAMMLSLAVALILTPAMCASLLRPRRHGDGIAPARWFNRGLDASTNGYVRVVKHTVLRPFRMVILLGAIGGGAFWLYQHLPGSFLPQEDQGVLMAQVRLSEGSTTAQTQAVLEEVENWLLTQQDGVVASAYGALGFSFGGGGQNTAMLFVRLKDYDERAGGVTAAQFAQTANQRFGGHRAGRIVFTQPPAIQGLGNSSGFTMYLLDQAGNGQAALQDAATDLVDRATEDGRTGSFRGYEQTFRPALRLDIDQQKARAMGLSLSEVNSMLAVIFSGREVNDFPLGTELKPVIVQGEPEWRMQPEDIDGWFARNSSGEMVPFAAFMTQRWDETSPSLDRYGGARAIELSGAPTEGTSSGQAMEVVEQLVADMPGGYGLAWTGLSYQERLSGNQAPLLFAMSALVVFLCLAALYESWTVPFAVMLSVPVGILGALGFALLFGQSNDVYFKVGLLTTIGLAARNAILIVEFAQSLTERGYTLVEAAAMAAKQRLRPILMTTFAFMLGVLPLAIATGAGAMAQRAIGIGVLGGMTSSAVIGIFMVPAFFVIVRRMFPSKKPVTA